MGLEKRDDEVARTRVFECSLTAMHCAKRATDLISFFLSTERRWVKMMSIFQKRRLRLRRRTGDDQDDPEVTNRHITSNRYLSSGSFL